MSTNLLLKGKFIVEKKLKIFLCTVKLWYMISQLL